MGSWTFNFSQMVISGLGVLNSEGLGGGSRWDWGVDKYILRKCCFCEAKGRGLGIN